MPSLVASIGDSKSSLLKIEFDVNPEDSTADQSLTIESQPVEVKYDAVSSYQNSQVFLGSLSSALTLLALSRSDFEFLLCNAI